MKMLPWVLVTGLAAFGQEGAVKPAFDVASVKPSPRVPGQDSMWINLGNARHGTVTLGNVTLSECIRWAYGLSSEDQVSGPDWIRDRELRVDILAKAPPETPLEQLRLMTQRLLAERFQLGMHREQKALAHADMTVLRDGLKRSESQEEGPSVLKTSGRGKVIYDHLMISSLAMLLSRQLKQTVVDRTGLSGYYDIDLQWAPDQLDPANQGAEVPDRPDVFKAIQQQLGLKLEKSKAPIDVYVIDHAEKVPAGN